MLSSFQYIPEAWPLGKPTNPSLESLVDVFRQIPHETSSGALVRFAPRPPTVWGATLDRSGSQRLNRSGLGFPQIIFKPSVAMYTPANAAPKPIHPTFHSQNLRRQISCLRWGLSAFRPGITRRLRPAMMTAGVRMLIRYKLRVETLPSLTKG
jgi:hypothetical protein